MLARRAAVLWFAALGSACASSSPSAPAARPTAALEAGARLVTIPLGTAGGLDEANLSSYLLAVRGDERWVALDAGTLHAGLRAAVARGAFGEATAASPGAVTQALTGRVRAVLLSHPHFDHVAGLVLNSPDDGKRSIYGSAATIDALREHVFNGVTWANFLDEGREPRLSRYHPVRLSPGEEVAVEGTPFLVRAFPLAHGGDGGSTAFLLRAGEERVLYLGDTGPDAIERSTRLSELWAHVAPLVRARSLRGVFVECSYPEERPDNLLFSHLTPRWLRAELDRLAQAVEGQATAATESSLQGLTVVVTHLKPATTPAGDARVVIERQLGAGYRGARFVFPEQGVPVGL